MGRSYLVLKKSEIQVLEALQNIYNHVACVVQVVVVTVTAALAAAVVLHLYYSW